MVVHIQLDDDWLEELEEEVIEDFHRYIDDRFDETGKAQPSSQLMSDYIADNIESGAIDHFFMSSEHDILSRTVVYSIMRRALLKGIMSGKV